MPVVTLWLTAGGMMVIKGCVHAEEQWLRCKIHEPIGSPPRRRRKEPIE